MRKKGDLEVALLGFEIESSDFICPKEIFSL